MVDKSEYVPDDYPSGIYIPIGTIMKEFALEILSSKTLEYILAFLFAVALVAAAVFVGSLS